MGLSDGVVRYKRDSVDVTLREREDEFAEAGRGEHVRGDAPASASTCRPASSALESVGEASGSTPITLVSPAYHAAMPPMRPPTGTNRVSILAASFSSSMPMVPWPSRVSV